MAIQFRPFGCIAPKALNYLAFRSFNMSVPDEGYFRNVTCALNLKSTFHFYLSDYCGKSSSHYT
jgi:hypothetical protein